MKIFQSNQKVLMRFGLDRHQSLQKNPFNKKNVLILCLFGLASISNCVQFFCVASSFQEYTDSVFTGLVLMVTFILFSIFVMKMQIFYDQVNFMEELVNARLENPASNPIYVKTIPQMEQMDQIINSHVVNCFIQFTLLPKLVVSYFNYFTSDSGGDAFELPFPYWFPFDWKNPYGYVIAFSFEYIVTMYFYLLSACILAIIIGAFLLTASMGTDVQNDLNAINKRIKCAKNRLEVIKHFTCIIEFHSVAKQFFCNFSKLAEPLFMILISSVSIATIGAMYHDPSLMKLVVPLFEWFGPFALAFIACEISGRTTNIFDKISYDIDQFDWYLFPIEMQQMLPTISLNAQQPVTIKCFGSTPFDRETFGKMTKCEFSYCTMLYKFGK